MFWRWGKIYQPSWEPDKNVITHGFETAKLRRRKDKAARDANNAILRMMHLWNNV